MFVWHQDVRQLMMNLAAIRATQPTDDVTDRFTVLVPTAPLTTANDLQRMLTQRATR